MTRRTVRFTLEATIEDDFLNDIDNVAELIHAYLATMGRSPYPPLFSVDGVHWQRLDPDFTEAH